jgi:hypothetical protein
MTKAHHTALSVVSAGAKIREVRNDLDRYHLLHCSRLQAEPAAGCLSERVPATAGRARPAPEAPVCHLAQSKEPNLPALDTGKAAVPVARLLLSSRQRGMEAAPELPSTKSVWAAASLN